MEFRLTIPSFAVFDQSVMQHLLDLDPIVQDYRAFFALLDWSFVDPCIGDVVLAEYSVPFNEAGGIGRHLYFVLCDCLLGIALPASTFPSCSPKLVSPSLML